MKKCIYTLKNEQEATFNSAEHIIPKAIGGISTLNKDWVCSEFNNVISVCEREFAQQFVLIITPRMFEKDTGRKEHKGRFSVSVLTDDNGEIGLGYIVEGKPYFISQFIIPIEKLKSNEYINNVEAVVSNSEDKECLLYIYKYRKNGVKVIKLEGSSHVKNVFLGVERKQIYLGIGDSVDGNIVINNVNKFIDLIENGCITGVNETGKVVSKKVSYGRRVLLYSDNICRVYAKIAFNVLAYLRGNEFVLDSKFDRIREAIVTGKDIRKVVSLPDKDIGNELKDILHIDKCHGVIISRSESALIANVCLYGGQHSVGVILCDSYYENFATDGYILDYENKKEYDLSSYIEKSISRYL